MHEIPRREHYQRIIQELTLLYEISQKLDQSLNLDKIVQPVLSSMAEDMGLLRGTVTLYNRQTERIHIAAAFGLTEKEMNRGSYKPGEGIIGRVFKTGRPVVIPEIQEEPQFLNKTGARKNGSEKNLAFICVPIKIEGKPIGTISADRQYSDSKKLEEDVKLLSIIGSMIAGAVKIRRKVDEEKELLREELTSKYKPDNLVGTSTTMLEVYDLISQVAKSDATVLIRGESGTGKELIAHAIHKNSLRSDKPFIKVNCAALPESIIESELFGHEKGAFTNAINKRIGRFELADNGTIFLDEIGDLTPATQVKLLRVLQEKEFERVGGSKNISVNVRVIAATNRPLESLMADNSFREDLYYRLNVFPIHIPPLRDRRSDIMLLTDYFTEKYSKRNGKPIKRISTPAIELLMSYHWPGNVRELENCIERAVILSTDGVIHGHHLPPSLQSAESTGTSISETLEKAIGKLEKELILDALKSSKGNMAKAARLLGLTERKMGLRIKKYSLNPAIFNT